jgi:hypothetical protein
MAIPAQIVGTYYRSPWRRFDPRKRTAIAKKWALKNAEGPDLLDEGEIP